MLSKKNKLLLFKNLVLSSIFASIFSFFFMEIYKDQKNLNFFEFNLLIDNRIGEKFMGKDDFGNPHVQDVILGRIYNSFYKSIISQDNKSFLVRTELSEYTNSKEKIIKIPIRHFVEKSEIINHYENSVFSFEGCDISILNEKEYNDCKQKSYLLEKYDEEKNYISFINDNIKISKITNNINENSYFYKFFFFFILFSLILYSFEISFKKQSTN